MAKKAATKKKATAKKTAPNPRAEAKPEPAPDDFTVRMFCHGLGDCFLLSVPNGRSQAPYWILIDCGIAMATPDQEEIMRAVVGEVHRLTGGTIDLLAVTHEHWDHVSGFGQAAELFERDFTFKNLWLAWTEDEEDPVAKELRKGRKKAKRALELARARFARLGVDDEDPRIAGIDGVLAFFGPSSAALDAEDPQPAGNRKKWTIEEAMAAPSEHVRRSGGKIETLRPGRVAKLPGAGSGLAGLVRAYALGPPHEAKAVRSANPRKGEAYEKKGHPAPLAYSLGVAWSWMHGLGLHERSEELSEVANEARSDPAQPFEPNSRIDWDDALKREFFVEHYAGEDAGAGRRIDGDWLWSGAEQLALRLDNATNNTSLVLAFELPESRRVLLFAGDAQAGNWRSWHDRDYDRGDGSDPVTATDLLRRTVLYKVGHHGSHNATLKEKGLELMTHKDLVALVPVDRDAVKRLRYGEMPLESLMKRLSERCQGRVYRSDDLRPGTGIAGKWPRHLTKPKVRLIVGSRPEVTYLEYSVADAE